MCRLTLHLPREDATDREMERNTLANPFKRFEDSMMRHTRTLGVIEFDRTVRKRLSDAEKDEIRQICNEKLEAYYRKLR